MGCSSSTLESNTDKNVNINATREIHVCRETKQFIEFVCHLWFQKNHININKDILGIIVKFTLTNKMKKNIKRKHHSHNKLKKFIDLKIVIEGDKSVGKSLFGRALAYNTQNIGFKQFGNKWMVELYADNVPFNVNIYKSNNNIIYSPNIVDHEPNSIYRPPPDIIFILFDCRKYEKMLPNIKQWAQFLDGMCIPSGKYLRIHDYKDKRLIANQYIKRCETQCIIVGTKLDKLCEIEHKYDTDRKLEKICEKIWEKCDAHKRISFGGFVSSTTGANIDIVLFDSIKRVLNSTDIENCVVCGTHFEPKHTEQIS